MNTALMIYSEDDRSFYHDGGGGSEPGRNAGAGRLEFRGLPFGVFGLRGVAR